MIIAPQAHQLKLEEGLRLQWFLNDNRAAQQRINLTKREAFAATAAKWSRP
jgi:hypothetical protein